MRENGFRESSDITFDKRKLWENSSLLLYGLADSFGMGSIKIKYELHLEIARLMVSDKGTFGVGLIIIKLELYLAIARLIFHDRSEPHETIYFMFITLAGITSLHVISLKSSKLIYRVW